MPVTFAMIVESDVPSSASWVNGSIAMAQS
jgi:hypothetical protein